MTGRRTPAAASQPGTAEPAIVVMAKAPRPGLAKTRLFPLLGPDGAAALQAALITHTVALADSVATTFVAVDPPDARAEVQPLVPAGVPVQTDVQVSRLTHGPGGFTARTSSGEIRARHVVVASGPFQRPFVPEAASGLDPAVVQLHSADYRRPGDVPPGEVLVVGGGNSAAQLAIELSATHEVTVASPGPLWFLPEKVLGVSLYWWALLTGVLNAPSTSRVSRYVRRRGDGIVGRQLRSMAATGQIRLVPHRVVAAQGRQVTLADGTLLPVSSVLWCTGFRPYTSWIHILGATDDRGGPVHQDGASPVPGLHWMGLPWQTRLNSAIIDGVDRDARRTARRILRSPG